MHDLVCGQKRHGFAAIARRFSHGPGFEIPHGAGHAGSGLTRIVVDHRLQVARQALIGCLIHRQHERRRAQGRAAELGVVLQNITEPQARHHVPRVEAAVDGVHGERHRHLRRRHRHALPAERTDRLAGEPVRHMQPQAFKILDRRDRARGMQHAGIAARKTQRMNFTEFVAQIGAGKILDRFGIDQRAMRQHKRQFESFDFAKASRRAAGHGPDDIGKPVARLIEQLRRRAAELHRREKLDADALVRLRLDLARPWRQEFLVPGRHRREIMMQLERRLRRIGARQPQHGGSGHRRHGRSQKRAAGQAHRSFRTVAMRLN